MDFWEALLGNLDVSLLIFARILGIFSFNPILSRTNIPVMARVGLSVMITAVVAMTADFDFVSIGAELGTTTAEYVFAVLRELLIGMVLGFVCDMFIFTIQLAGEVMDTQAGLGMAKVFDPSTSIQMSIYGSVASFMMYLYFFASNSHLTLINIFIESFDIIPLGTGTFDPDFGWTMMELFSQVLILVMRLAIPVVAAELVVEFCVGILMKTVPQVQIMVVNIQLKVIFGLLVLYMIAAPLGEFIEKYVTYMLNACRDALPLIMAG